jgi:alkylation response protein AidB-like acyl-CoA dehydrogenase
MAFRYEPLMGGELFDVAARFAEDCNTRIAGVPDGIAREAALAEIWREAEALGWHLSLIPERLGGVGGSLQDTLSLVEGAARFALPAPLAKALILAPHLLDGPTLARVSTGALRPAVVLDASYPWPTVGAHAASVRMADGRIHGELFGTEWLPGTTHLLVATGGQLALVAADQAAVHVHHRIDGRLAGDLRFDGAIVEQLFPEEGIDQAIDLAALTSCVEIVAGAATVIEDTVKYLGERHQFGVALASFQVLRHYVADMYIAYQNAHAVTAAALRAAAASPDRLPWRDIALAKLRAGEVARFVAETSIQCHGGMGMTEENRATRIAKRLIMADLEWGDRAWQTERLLADRALAA